MFHRLLVKLGVGVETNVYMSRQCGIRKYFWPAEMNVSLQWGEKLPNVCFRKERCTRCELAEPPRTNAERQDAALQVRLIRFRVLAIRLQFVGIHW